jgi:pimeloyl-ACP methyl ester carboxylesterase
MADPIPPPRCRTDSMSNPEGNDTVESAYDALLARWPQGTESRDVDTPFGTTHVLQCGNPLAESLVMLPGGGASAMAWLPVASKLVGDRRLYAVDLLNDAGRSQATRPMRDRAGVVEWLDSLLDGLAVTSTHLVGHSYGGWLATTFAASRPERVRTLTLLSPSACFSRMRTGYLLRAVPVVVRPSARRMNRLLTWETRGLALDADFRRLVLAAADRRLGPIARPTLLSDDELARLDMPVHLVLAQRDRSMDNAKALARARQTVTGLTATTIKGATHHTVPTEYADIIARLLTT